MGSFALGGGKTSQSSSSNSNTYDSKLSNEQLGILKQREQQYQQYFFPELVSGLQDNSVGSDAFNATLAKNTNEVNTAFKDNKQAITQNLGQQNLLGAGGGVQTAALQANERARKSSLASAYADQVANANTNKTNYLQIAAAMSPTATTSAEYYSSSKSKSSGNNWNLNHSGSILGG